MAQSMVEFALVAPLLFFLLLGTVDVGRAIFYANEITNAAREGARVAVLATNRCSNTGICGSGTSSTVCSAIEHNASLIGAWSCTDDGTLPSTGSPSKAYVEVDQSTGAACPAIPTPGHPDAGLYATPRANGNLPLRVTVEYYFRPLTPLVSNLFPSTFFISSSVCARPEY